MTIPAFSGNFVPLPQTIRVHPHRLGCPRRPRHYARTVQIVSGTLRSPGDTSASGRVSRRDALSIIAAVVASPALLSFAPAAGAAGSPEPASRVSQLILPPLPYPPNALEPAIDRETMILHHDKHFAKYTEGANAALSKIPGGAAMVDGDPAKLADMLGNLDSVKDESVRKALRNNGGGYVSSLHHVLLHG